MNTAHSKLCEKYGERNSQILVAYVEKWTYRGRIQTKISATIKCRFFSVTQIENVKHKQIL